EAMKMPHERQTRLLHARVSDETIQPLFSSQQSKVQAVRLVFEHGSNGDARFSETRGGSVDRHDLTEEFSCSSIREYACAGPLVSSNRRRVSGLLRSREMLARIFKCVLASLLGPTTPKKMYTGHLSMAANSTP